ncbi:hypothetical protein MicB006_5322 [Micromonospora sp. B006]|nr:hypothetical protein MicB006_5322 [Micromonospora sp. B006]
MSRITGSPVRVPGQHEITGRYRRGARPGSAPPSPAAVATTTG